jgi:hypothetical protein
MRMMMEHKMLHLFGGRMDAYGGDDGYAVRKSVTPQLIERHLAGTEGIGIYPIWEQDNKHWVKWGCCDIDTGDWSEAYSLAVALNSMGMTPFIERSRSKGWHIWVFSNGPVQAAYMRRALKVAYAAIDLHAREANPKQETLGAGQLGNYVRLPFKGGFAGNLQRQVMMREWDASSDGTPIQAADWFTDFDGVLRAEPAHIEYWASKWFEPEKKHIANVSPMSEADLHMIDQLPARIHKFVMGDPPYDRSQGLTALAHHLKRAGYTPQEAYKVVDFTDTRWGKYVGRQDREGLLLNIIERTL